MLGPAPDVAQSNLCHFGVRVGEVWRHLRGSVLPSVDLAKTSAHCPRRPACYAAQHGLLHGADNAQAWPLVTCFSMFQKSISFLNSFLNLEPSSDTLAQGLEHLLYARRGGARKTVLQRLRSHFLGQRINGHQHEGVGLPPEGLSCRPPAGSWAPKAQSCCSLSAASPGSPESRPETPSPPF